jgi:hypothetical protein
MQYGKTVLMSAAIKDVRVESMQLLLDSGAATSINTKEGKVTQLRVSHILCK